MSISQPPQVRSSMHSPQGPVRARWGRRAVPWLRWHWHRAAAAVGGPLACAIALLLAVAVLHGVLLPRWQAEAGRLATEIDAMRREAARQQAALAVSPTSEHPRPLWDALPPQTTATQLEALARLHDGARAAQLELVGGSYRLVHEQGDPIARLDVIVQARGPYAQLRGFAVRMLQADRALALNTVRFSRPGTAEPAIDAEFNFSVFMRAP